MREEDTVRVEVKDEIECAREGEGDAGDMGERDGGDVWVGAEDREDRASHIEYH